MVGLNSVIIEGNVVRDPRFEVTNSGYALCNFSVAANRYFKTKGGETKNEVSFFDVESWGEAVESYRDFLKKGKPIRVVGRIKQDRWQDSEGKNHARVKIISEHIEILKLEKGLPKESKELSSVDAAMKMEDTEVNF